MLCPSCNAAITNNANFCSNCGQRLTAGVRGNSAVAPEGMLGDLDLTQLPYPVALTTQRLQQTIASGHDVVRTLNLLRDCFESAVKSLAAVLLVEYLRGPAATREQNEELLKRLVRPSLGVWVDHVVERLGALLPTDAVPIAQRIAGLFVKIPLKGKPQPTTLLTGCKEFVGFRNDTIGHGATRSDAAYRADLRTWLPHVGELLQGLAGLADWRLCLVADVDRRFGWMGTPPSAASEPGAFRNGQVGHFVLCGPPDECGMPQVLDLFPFLCYTPNADNTQQRLQYYDSMHRYKPPRKEALVLEYDAGDRYPRPEPVSGLEERFTQELLASAVGWHRERMAVIEGRVASFGELLESHAGIVGRGFAIERVQRFLAENDRGLLLIEGAPGKGKTALLAHLIETVFDQHAPQPAHFFYRRTAGITSPDVCVRTLYHQLLRLNGITEAEDSRQQSSPELVYHKFINLLANEIAPRLHPGRPQLLFIDALDEADSNAFVRIPEGLPKGIFIIATTRPVREAAILARRPHLHRLDLESPDFLQDNLRDGRDYVERGLLGIEMSQETLDEIARVGAGNFLVLTLLCRHVRTTLDPRQVARFLRRLATEDGKDRLGFIYEEFWQRLTEQRSREDVNLLCDVAGVLVAAHAPLTAAVVCGVLGLRAGDWDFAWPRLAQYLTAVTYDEERVQETFYRVYHESFADFLRARLEVDRERHHRCLADYCRKWARHPEGYGRTYALRFAPAHLIEAGQIDVAVELLLDLAFLEAKTEAGLVFELAGDFTATVKALPEGKQRRTLELLAEGLRRDIHFVARHPSTLFQCLWNSAWWYDCPEAAGYYVEGRAPGQEAGLGLHLLLEGWRAAKEQQNSGLAWLRSLRPPAMHLGTAQRAVFRGHESWVHSVAFSPDGRRVLSGSTDNTVRVWDSDSGQQLLCITGHEFWVNSVAFSPDGKRVLGSDDKTVRVWDALSGECLEVLPGQSNVAPVVAGCQPRPGDRHRVHSQWPACGLVLPASQRHHQPPLGANLGWSHRQQLPLPLHPRRAASRLRQHRCRHADNIPSPHGPPCYTSYRRTQMAIEIDPLPGVTDDPVLQLILSGRARNLDEAEELFLDESLPAITALIGSPLSNEELEKHPLLALLRSRGMRGREDSLL